MWGELTPLESASAFAGFMYGVADSARGIYELGASAPSTAATLYDLVQHPQELADAVATVTAITRRLAERPELLREAAKSALEAVAETQRIQNPFGPGDPRHATFAMNWYGGFVAGHLYVEAALSLGVGVVVKRVENTFDTAKAIGDAVRSARAAVLAGTIGVTSRSAGFVAQGIVRGTVLSVSAVRAGLQRVSVARQFVTARAMRSLLEDVDTGDAIPQARRAVPDGGTFDERLLGMIAANGDEGRQLLRILSDEPELIARLVADGTPDAAQRALARGLAKGDVDATEVRAVLRKADTASPDESWLIFEAVGEAGPNAIRAISELDDLAPFYAFLKEAGDHGHVLLRQFDDQRVRQRFLELVADEDVGESWLRVVSDEEITASAVSTAIRRVDGLPDGDDVIGFKTARRANAEYEDSIEDPYAPGSVVAEYETGSDQVFLRLHREDNQARAWMLRQASEIEGLTPEELQLKYSLPKEPKYVSEVHVPSGTSVRTGTVASNFGGRRGANQFELLDRLPESQFKNRRPLIDG